MKSYRVEIKSWNGVFLEEQIRWAASPAEAAHEAVRAFLNIPPGTPVHLQYRAAADNFVHQSPTLVITVEELNP